jgi:predicted permease
MGNPIVAGRGFDRSDDRNAPLAVVVNEALAERIWPGETAVGKTILRRDSEWTVIGVASNATYYEVGEAPQTQVYVAQLQDYSPLLSFVIATAGPPSDISSAVNEAIREYDPALPVQRIATLRDVVKNEIGQYRVTAILVALFGGLALLLAAVGLYGVQSYLVSRRTREIGIRMALGAAEGQLARSVIGRSAAMTMVGIVIGVGVALVAARLIESMLFNVNARDPVTFVTAPLVLLAVAVLASVLPAYRASRVDPVEALRQE